MLVVNENISGGQEINLQHLSNGIYYIKMYNAKNGVIRHQKLVLTKP
jgi:hypothetical protein